jgi:hypothetical protein
MSSTIAVTARRFSLTLAVAGLAVIGGVAPSASAAPPEGKGADAFIQLEHGYYPVFECDDLNEHKHHNKCIDMDAATRF